MSKSAQRAWLAAIILGAPSVLAAQSARGAKSPAEAVQEFMRAIDDSNLTRMAELWGTSKGPASVTHPKDYEKRIVIMQLFLRGVRARTLGDVPSSKSGARSVTTELAHNGCKVTLSIDVVKSGAGWLVQNFDLAEAGKVNQPCDNGKSGNSPA
ncbi:MAG: hypothetical protein ACREK8_05585 [Gemmatimonadales bacterium]